ncbi:alpha/beta hydrolase family protein [Hoeflea prorocentri]|uniref:Uncharacterized protein n=1 Tax=Hoeflea prorocentri TaxID=1922333 RepID=A0A9X3UNW3_9HYPH|nr:hypothetical protein [Hoeflea prorocentri]MCY6382699.1 hypothetical protein [Hoeflea prorocentri]MDA5400499.1 hypothetical protein [Hoeflea prorocentri]
MAQLTRDTLWSLLGYDRPPVKGGEVVVEEDYRLRDLTVQKVGISDGRRMVPTVVLLPRAAARRGSVLIYCHAHGHRHDIGKAECLEGRPALLDPPLGVALAEAGHIVVCPDMPGFGERVDEGTESALAKALHWHGGTLLGQMLADLCLVRDSLAFLPVAQGAPCGVAGFSMGAFLSFWLAALRPDFAACAHMCGFASLSGLIAADGHDLHAPYLTVPGLLRHGDMQDVAALIAPRPQLVASGLQDPLTPASALEPALLHLLHVYGENGDLTVLTDQDTGHVETPRMRSQVLAFFNRTLPPA